VVRHEEGRPTADVLQTLLPDAIGALAWPKSMRWGRHRLRWVRPLHGLLCLFDGAVVPISFEHLQAGDETAGHRFLSDGPVTAHDFESYQSGLRAAHVVLDHGARAQMIREQAAEIAQAAGLTLREDEALIAENAGLTEWPVVSMGRIDDAFMDVPPEVLITAMRTHQKYFTLDDAKGRLAPRFLMVANMNTTTDNAAIIAGNERVLRARLSDAKFFWDQDRKETLESRLDALQGVVFHAKLGSLAEKTGRIASLAAILAAHIDGAKPDTCRRAALLAKADLTSGMVGEFPELQGLMGRYYAQNDGEPAEIADAIAAHYAPAGPGDACPRASVSVAVALADKVDTLAGFFAIDEKPTGSKDPFALRRAALGVIRLILENELRLPLSQVFAEALAHYGENVQKGGRENEAAQALLAFFEDRLRVHLRDQGVRHDLVTAVFALGGEDDLLRLLARVASLAEFLASDDGANLLTAYRRAANILRIEEKRDGAVFSGAPDNKLFELPEESALGDALKIANEAGAKAVQSEAFADAMAAMASLRQPIDRFFDEVTVNAEDAALRRNRLLLLSEIRGSLDRLADFSRIEG
jgi:glycyl-tRNA synthetase beta chain